MTLGRHDVTMDDRISSDVDKTVISLEVGEGGFYGQDGFDKQWFWVDRGSKLYREKGMTDRLMSGAGAGRRVVRIDYSKKFADFWRVGGG